MRRVTVTFGSLIFGVILVSTLQSHAQRKLITSVEYYRALSQPAVKSYEKSRHVETTSETLENGAVVKSIFTINEVLLPNRSRVYEKTVDGGSVSETEQITIDYMQYKRKDNGPWTKIDLRTSGLSSGMGTGFGTSSQCDQYSVEEVFLNGRPVRLFEWLMIRGNTKGLTFSEARRWIGEGELPYREETVTGLLSPREEKTKQVITYEYDPEIKIEAPIR